MNLTIQDAVNRGYNLLACTTLALAGLAFGTVVFEESDLADKVDDKMEARKPRAFKPG